MLVRVTHNDGSHTFFGTDCDAVGETLVALGFEDHHEMGLHLFHTESVQTAQLQVANLRALGVTVNEE